VQAIDTLTLLMVVLNLSGKHPKDHIGALTTGINTNAITWAGDGTKKMTITFAANDFGVGDKLYFGTDVDILICCRKYQC
jgi:hypothetical protein